MLAKILVVGVTGFEPVTLRLSSACSNQLSYTPAELSGAVVILTLRFLSLHKSFKPHEKIGGAEEIRTPDL